jgi:hypothetical protein
MIYPAFQSLSVLRLEWNMEGPEGEDSLKILNNVPRLASSLHTLSLKSDLQEATVLFSLDFPHLRLLRLADFVSLHDTANIQGFFERHPQLESLSLEGCMHTWFSDNIEIGFLPNLKHLKVIMFHIVQKPLTDLICVNSRQDSKIFAYYSPFFHNSLVWDSPRAITDKFLISCVLCCDTGFHN